MTKAKLAVGGFVLAMFVSATTAGTMAIFTDQDTITGNVFTSKTIDLTLSPTTALVTLTTMMPGDTVNGTLTVTNAAGSEALRYAVSSTATNADTKGLKDQLSLIIREVDTDESGCGSFDGEQLYSGDMDSTAGKLIGDAAQGQNGTANTGNGDRTLAAGASETLCFRVNLPTNTGNAFKSATTTVTFTFDSEQTANNA